MATAKYYIEIKDKKIPIIVRKYKNAKNLRIYFKLNILNISMPVHLSQKEFEKIIKQNEEIIYKQYKEILKKDNKNIKHWYTGEEILYKGEKYKIHIKEINDNKLEIKIKPKEREILIEISKILKEEEKKEYIDINLKKLLKNNTIVLLQERLPFWSKKTNITYCNFKVGDSTSKFGSCNVRTKILHFSNRLIMLPKDKVDAIIVHELCHIVHADHSQNFYNLVKKYIPNYEEIDKWLKENGREIII